MCEKYYCSELMIKEGLKLKYGVVNYLNGNAGCGKTEFVLKYLLEDPSVYIDDIRNLDKFIEIRKNRILYITDTRNLKRHMMYKHNCIELKKGVLKNHVDADKTLGGNFDENTIVTCTYSTLGYYLQNPKLVEWFTKHFRLVIFDEVHNLVNYALQFDDEIDCGYYYNTLDNIDVFAKNTLLIALSATGDNFTWWMGENNNVEVNTVFNNEKLKMLMQHTAKVTNYYIDINKAYDLVPYHVSIGKKVFIYEYHIESIKKLSERFRKNGLDVLMIWSPNNTKHSMSEEQLASIEYILKNETVEDKYDVVIINDATTTGVNIKSSQYQIAIINSTNTDTRIQARNRLRFDIESLVYHHDINIDGSCRAVDFVDTEYKDIDDEYLGVELTEDMKVKVIDKYCPSYYLESDNIKDCKWVINKSWNKTVEWLINNGYEINGNIINVEGENNMQLNKFLGTLSNENMILTKEMQNVLIDKIDYRFNGRQQKTAKKLNEALTTNNIPYRIDDSKRMYFDGRQQRVWIIERI